MQTFREENAPLRQDVCIVNELSAELTPLDIQLSSTASRQLDQLNIRWKLLQVNPPDVNAGMFLHTPLLQCLFSSFSTLSTTCLNECCLQYMWILFLPFLSFSPCLLVIYLYLFCLPPLPPQFLSLCACWFHFMSAKHMGLRIVPLPVYLLYLNTSLCSTQHFVTTHQWTLFSQHTCHILASLCAWMSWTDPLWDSLSVSQSGTCLSPWGKVVEKSFL